MAGGNGIIQNCTLKNLQKNELRHNNKEGLPLLKEKLRKRNMGKHQGEKKGQLILKALYHQLP